MVDVIGKCLVDLLLTLFAVGKTEANSSFCFLAVAVDKLNYHEDDEDDHNEGEVENGVFPSQTLSTEVVVIAFF